MLRSYNTFLVSIAAPVLTTQPTQIAKRPGSRCRSESQSKSRPVATTQPTQIIKRPGSRSQSGSISSLAEPHHGYQTLSQQRQQCQEVVEAVPNPQELRTTPSAMPDDSQQGKEPRRQHCGTPVPLRPHPEAPVVIASPDILCMRETSEPDPNHCHRSRNTHPNHTVAQLMGQILPFALRTHQCETKISRNKVVLLLLDQRLII